MAKKKKNPVVLEFEELIKVQKKLEKVDKQWINLEKDYHKILKKINKRNNGSKKDLMTYFSDYKKLMLNRIKNVKKQLGLN